MTLRRIVTCIGWGLLVAGLTLIPNWSRVARLDFSTEEQYAYLLGLMMPGFLIGFIGGLATTRPPRDEPPAPPPT